MGNNQILSVRRLGAAQYLSRTSDEGVRVRADASVRACSEVFVGEMVDSSHLLNLVYGTGQPVNMPFGDLSVSPSRCRTD